MSVPDLPQVNGSGRNGGLVPPQSLEAERSVLGAVLLSDTALPALIIDERLQPDDFYREAHGVVFKAMLDLHARGEPVDELTLVEHLKQTGELEKAGGRGTIDLLAGSVPAVANHRQYAKIVRENAMLRRLLGATYEIQERVHRHEAAPRELVDLAERSILEVAHEDRRKDFRAIHDLLDAELDKLHELSREGKAITGTASGFDDLDRITGGFQAGNLVILAARPSMGKCLAGSSLVFDPRIGARRRLDDLVAAHQRGEPVYVASLGPELRFRKARVAAAASSGVQHTYRLVTRLGRRLDGTENHPLLTLGGWRRLGDLEPGERIAVPRRLPDPDTTSPMSDHDLVLLAALIADGNLTQRTPRFCFGSQSPMREEVERAAGAYGLQLAAGSIKSGTVTISAGQRGRGAPPNPLTELCKHHGLWGKSAAEKHVPEAVFGQDRVRIARFLAVLYGCDGHVHASGRLRQIGYTTISERLAHDVQHLLLRLGIVARVRHLRRAVYEGTSKAAREVLITGQDSILAFQRQIRIPGKTAALDRAAAELAELRLKTNTDTLPPEVWAPVLAAKGERSWAEISEATGRTRTHNWHVGHRGISRALLIELAAATESQELEALAVSDVWWDEVASVEPLGEQETYDLEVPDDASFVADDVVVHNSALMANFAENAALGDGKAVALFSLEMSESELAQRFIASQASIKGDDLRKGHVPESRWPKILAASERLAGSPLFVDDSSDLSVLDVRAKARRLAQQHADGLGLILIDYLQLMRAGGSADNRVEQIGQISRGLKTLARELEVPVIALSQLNRGVEQRTDKRPVLSDLRESGAIEQDADLVMFIYREEYYDRDSEREGIADLIVAKHRNGGLGTVELTFQKEYPRFMSYVGDDRY